MSRIRAWLSERFSAPRQSSEPGPVTRVPHRPDRQTLLCDKVSLHAYLLKEETIRVNGRRQGTERILLQFELLRFAVQDFIESVNREEETPTMQPPPHYSEFELLAL